MLKLGSREGTPLDGSTYIDVRNSEVQPENDQTRDTSLVLELIPFLKILRRLGFHSLEKVPIGVVNIAKEAHSVLGLCDAYDDRALSYAETSAVQLTLDSPVTYSTKALLLFRYENT